MQTFPQQIHPEVQSPRMLDSAFPPFKVEHRYRGVYERAGFEVNLNNAKSPLPKDARSISSGSYSHSRAQKLAGARKYPTPPKSSSISPSSTKSFPMSPHNYKYNTDNRSAPSLQQERRVKNPYTAPTTARSQSDLAASAPYQDTPRAVSDSVNPNPYAAPAAYDPRRRPSQPNHNHPFEPGFQQQPVPQPQFVPAPVSAPVPQQEQEYIQPVLAANNVQVPATMDDTFDFSPSSTYQKNFKNLQLDLNNNAINNSKLDSLSDSENDAFSPKQGSFNDTNSTSVERFDEVSLNRSQDQGRYAPYQPMNSDVGSDRLSSAYEDLKRDVEQLRNPSLREHQPKLDAPQAQAPYPVSERFSYSPEVNSETDPSQQFRSFQQQSHLPDQNLNNDYQTFLNARDTDTSNRKSQLSMVSSVLSKDSVYDDDDEVERELERQLQTLKMAGSTHTFESESASTTSHHTHGDSFATANNSLPVFNIVGADEIEKDLEVTRSEAISPALTVPAGEVEQNESNSIVSHGTIEEEVQPLSVNHQKTVYPTDDQFIDDDPEIPPRGGVNEALAFSNPYKRSSRPLSFDDDAEELAYAVPPLSPKNHRVEEELKGINFPMESADTASHLMQTPQSNVDSYDEISPVRPLEINSKLDKEHRYPPGEGPCRLCHLDILPERRGSQRSIYSKTGELSGQWHRGCFSCLNDACNILFNKHVQCYAYNDKPYCKHHYHELNETICEHCSTGIEGECIENELQQKWHLNCLRCYKCHNMINNDYYLINGSIFCEIDALNIINGTEAYKDSNGDLISGGLSALDKIERRRTRLLFVD